MNQETAFFDVDAREDWIFSGPKAEKKTDGYCRRVVRIDSEGNEKVYKSGKEAARDLIHGRRGGHWLPQGYEHLDLDNAPKCSECGEVMLCKQPGRHWSCSPECDGCHRPVGPKRQNCVCGAKTKKQEAA